MPLLKHNGGKNMYNENAMMTQPNALEQKFILPAMVQSEFSAEDLADDMDGLSMSFSRIKIPAGGMTQFEIPTENPDSPDYAPLLEGVILHHHPSCAYWVETGEDDDDDEEKLPLCSSLDGIKGIGTPGGACATCQLNAFGSGAKGKGKACKNMHVIYLLRSNELMPIQFNLPPTSIRPFKEFMNRAFRLRKRASYGSIVQIGLKKENNGKKDYSVATFRLLSDFSGEELAQICSYAKNFKGQIKELNQLRAQAAEDQFEDVCELPAGDALSMGAGGEPFTINGDRDILPD